MEEGAEKRCSECVTQGHLQRIARSQVETRHQIKHKLKSRLTVQRHTVHVTPLLQLVPSWQTFCEESRGQIQRSASVLFMLKIAEKLSPFQQQQRHRSGRSLESGFAIIMRCHKQGCIHLFGCCCKTSSSQRRRILQTSSKVPESEVEGYRKARFGKYLVVTNYSFCNSKTHFPTPYSRKRSTTTTTTKKKDIFMLCCLCTCFKWVYLNLRSPQTSHPMVGTSISGTEMNQVQPHEPKTHSKVSGFVESSEAPFYLNLPFCHIE